MLTLRERDRKREIGKERARERESENDTPKRERQTDRLGDAVLHPCLQTLSMHVQLTQKRDLNSRTKETQVLGD